MVIRVCHHSLILVFLALDIFGRILGIKTKADFKKKMSEDVVQNVSKSVCSAQKAYLLCILNNISGLGPFF